MKVRLLGKIFILFLICLLRINLYAIEQSFHYILKNADLVKIDKVINDTITTLTGNVNLIYNDIEFFADIVQIFQKDKIVKLTGNVKAIDDTLEAGAKQATYFHKKNELFLKKDAYFYENSKQERLKGIHADRINYFRNNRKVNADGNIFAQDFLENVYITCGQFQYNINKGYADARNEPVLTFERERIIKVLSKQMEFFVDEHKFTATYDVKIEMKESYALGRFLIYFQEDNKAVLLGNPQFYSNISDASAEEFQIFFIEESIDKLYLIKNAEIHFKNKDQEEKSNFIYAKKIMLDLNNEKLSYMNAEDVDKSQLEQSKTNKDDFYINKLKTKGFEVFFDNDENIEKVVATQDIKGIYKFASPK
ncbi:MAG: hypothetical protein KAW92_01840 [Candidatus Cloacimonetes bacterium]|nr:hypothetical protein [Candidatus Cloacimonadota bacterium]